LIKLLKNLPFTLFKWSSPILKPLKAAKSDIVSYRFSRKNFRLCSLSMLWRKDEIKKELIKGKNQEGKFTGH
jgi:hypothetical protein